MGKLINPSRWSHHTYQPKYLKGKYLGHFTPGGAAVVLVNGDGKRKCRDWKFYCIWYDTNQADVNNYVSANTSCDNSCQTQEMANLMAIFWIIGFKITIEAAVKLPGVLTNVMGYWLVADIGCSARCPSTDISLRVHQLGSLCTMYYWN